MQLAVTELRVAAVASAVAVNALRWEVAMSAHNDVRQAVATQRFNQHNNHVDADEAFLAALGGRKFTGLESRDTSGHRSADRSPIHSGAAPSRKGLKSGRLLH